MGYMTEGVKRLFICTRGKMDGIGFFVYNCIASSSIRSFFFFFFFAADLSGLAPFWWSI
jgi:hypothetical protein